MRKVKHPETYGLGSLPMSPMKKRVIYRQGGFFLEGSRLGKRSPKSTNLQGGRMKIKFDRSENTKTNPNAAGKSYSIIRVHGTALEGKMADQSWTTQFFASNKELAGQVGGLSKDDIVDVTMKKNGNFWNPEKFEVSGSPMSTGGSGAATPTAPVKATVNPRMANLEVAIKILGSKPVDVEPFDYLANAAGIADMINDYVEERGAFQFKNAQDGIPEVPED